MIFWFTATGLLLVVAGAFGAALIRGKGAPAPAAAHDIQVYRDQLAEVDRDIARGVLASEEGDRARLEVQRRLLEADRAARTEVKAGRNGPGTAAAIASGLVLAAGAFGLYSWLGAPNYPDMPIAARKEAAAAARDARPSQAEMEARFAAPAALRDAPAELKNLVAQLRTALETRPDDLQGHRLLAENEARLGNFVAARKAQSRVVEIAGDDASVADLSRLADLMVIAANDFVSPEAEAVLAEVLRRDPGNGPARYYSGLLYLRIGRPDLAFRLWRDLLEDSPPDAPWVAPIRADIGRLAQAAGVRYNPPSPSARGPSQAEIDATASLPEAERAAMIEGMVNGLANRLANEGGPAADWARLISALGVLGQTERARAIHAEAVQVFAGDADALELIATAGRQAGVSE